MNDDRARMVSRACRIAGISGVATLVVALLAAPPQADHWLLLLFFTAAMSFFQVTPLRLTHEDQTESLQLEEAFFVPTAVLLAPSEAILALAVAVTVGHLWTRRGLTKLAFNGGQLMTSAGVALFVAHQLGAGGGSAEPAAVAAALAGGVVFAVVSAMAVAGIIAVAQRTPFRAVILDGLLVRLATYAGSLSFGVVVLVATSMFWWALPITVLPIAMLQLGFAGAIEQWRQHQQLEALYEAAVDIRSSMELRDVHEHLTRSARRLLEADAARIVSPTAPVAPGILRADVDAEMAVEVEGRASGGAWSERDEKMIRAVAGLAAGAVHNAQLFEQIKRQAMFDATTGLPNQVLFEDRVTQAIRQARVHADTPAVLFVDLDRFKHVNDSFGHSTGNLLLQQVAERLLARVRPGDTVARMSGDEFTILLPVVRDLSEALVVADAILESFREPFVLAGHEVFLTASIGVALYPDAGTHCDVLLRNADSAMHRAKERGRNGFEVYESAMNAEAFARLALEGELRNAIANDGLHLVYQPQVDARTGRILGVEALVRWRHPRLGPIFPDQFIPLAEETGLIIDLDSWVLREACRQGREWADAGMPVRIATNLSGRHFRQAKLAEAVMRTLAGTGFDPTLLELEVTEGVAVHEGPEPAEALAALREKGVQIAIDDFGTGYSILGRLRQFPVDRVKIDKSFVQEITGSDIDAPLVAAMIAMAHSMSLEVVAEGVETPEQLGFLRRHGCDAVQGYLFSRPVEAGEVPVLLGARDSGMPISGA